ncbi:MAG: hypothetical protein RMK29_00880 [Myxococcales bacterium]|nr:hypothetical protein [Myxococcota bacterium]MDW8280232.1 hypothetical protein [Myxococcales bacterium]
MKALSFVGYSKEFCLQEALEDATQQALGTAATQGIEFHLVGIRGRLGGPERLRDLWVEIRLGPPGQEQDDSDEPYTTMAVGEEGGEEPEPDERYTTMAVGEEGGEELR